MRSAPDPAAESYLRGETIIRTAQRSGAEAIHPGFGFLAENPAFARACAAAGLTFIGPSPDAMEAMASKTAARQVMAAAGVPIVPGVTEPIATLDEARAAAAEIGYPVVVKAAAGGGGKGIKTAAGPDELDRAFESAQREGKAYFADDAVYLERYLERPRHVEVQVLADLHGNVIHLGERDCSIQRRHQKILEETPSPAVTPELRERIGAIAVDAARAVGYTNAGTVEGLLDADGSYYFLEMNTRLQVEHTVTEMVTGLDLVREQVWIAGGRPLGWTQADVRLSGHSIQCRINAEDPANGFVPTPGDDHPVPGAVRSRRADRLRCGGGLDDLGSLRSDDREARRLGRGSRAGTEAHAARPVGARDRGPEDAHPAPPPDPRASRLHRRRPPARVRGSGRHAGCGRTTGVRPRGAGSDPRGRRGPYAPCRS